jgi:hypothetical protein
MNHTTKADMLAILAVVAIGGVSGALIRVQNVRKRSNGRIYRRHS